MNEFSTRCESHPNTRQVVVLVSHEQNSHRCNEFSCSLYWFIFNTFLYIYPLQQSPFLSQQEFERNSRKHLSHGLTQILDVCAPRGGRVLPVQDFLFRSTSCGQWMVQIHHTPAWRSTSVTQRSRFYLHCRKKFVLTKGLSLSHNLVFPSIM